MLGNGGFPEARSRLCVCWSLLAHDLCHGRSSSCWPPATPQQEAAIGIQIFPPFRTSHPSPSPSQLIAFKSWLFTHRSSLEIKAIFRAWERRSFLSWVVLPLCHTMACLSAHLLSDVWADSSFDYKNVAVIIHFVWTWFLVLQDKCPRL